MKSVAVIGAGITGLTAAFRLKRQGIPVTLYEGGGRVGGVIQSLRRDGYLAESGPNTILETSPEIARLVREAGLQSRRLDANPSANRRYLVRGRQPIALPESPPGFLATGLFSWKAKLSLLREPFVSARRDGVEESVADFVRRRLGSEFLDYAVDPLVAGVYAGDPTKLSVQQAFPKLAQLEARYGSLIKGQIFGARERRKCGDVAKDRAAKFSFDEGLQVLPDALWAQLGDAVRLNTSVTSLTQTDDGWRLGLRDGSGETTVEHGAVIYAGTAYRLAELVVKLSANSGQPLTPALSPSDGARVAEGRVSAVPASFGALSEIRHPPVASVVLGFRREDVAHPCEGFGMLIPKVEGFRILGAIFSSSLFPNRAPAGHLTLTSYVGGERHPELVLKSPEELYALTREDLGVLLGVKGEPTFQHCTQYPKAIPQYNLGYGRYRELMTLIENQAPGLFLAGHYRDGISVGDSIVSGCNAAVHVETFFGSATPGSAAVNVPKATPAPAVFL
jgi:protoporphyrinogen/coproporphyrinogen III oxidase